MADDTYVFHERASSYSALGAEKHGSYRRAASARFNALYPEWTEWRDAHDVKQALGALRKPVPPTLLRSPADRYRICWLVHDAGPCGAMRFIADIVNELCERGVNAKVAVLLRDKEKPRDYLGELRCAPVFFSSATDLVETFSHRVFPSGVVMAGTVELAPAVQALVEASSGSLRGCLHAQSFDVGLEKDEKGKAHIAALYRLLPDVITGSNWVGEEIAAIGPTPFAVVHPGVDRTLFYPRDRSKGDERPTVMIPMNPSVWWRGWDRGLELIQELDRQAMERGIDLRILVYGVESLPITSRAICLGVITQTRLATLLGTEVDALFDPSHVHSYGMPCLEAAASEVRAYCWNNRGVMEYAVPAQVAVYTDDQRYTPAFCAGDLLGDLTKSHGGEPLEDHDREKSVDAFIGELESHFKLTRKLLRICVVAPHLRKWGGPTTMLRIAEELAKRGHSVEVATVYADVHPAIAADATVPIIPAPKELPSADLYIVNSDNPWVERISKAQGKAIMLKLSHNPRFKAEEERGLNQLWDGVVTSTQWLADACYTVTPGWNYGGGRTATVIGWWHYEHARFRCPPSERTYGDGSAERPFVIGTLIHAHPTKGTATAVKALESMRAHKKHFRFVGIGEVPERAVKLPEGWEYAYSPSRDQMAAILRQCDVWLSTSQSEGLGRMALEAMSAGCPVVARDTGAEHLQAAFRFTPEGTEHDAVTWALTKVLLDEELRAELARRGFETAERAASPATCIDALEEVIESVFA
jgi:glycosyltransferase involved in cell wall biosynthesis